jgi:hypothetical protein
LYIFFRYSAKIISFKHKDEGGRCKFIICLAGKGQSSIAIVHVDVRNVLYLHLLRLLALYDEFTLALNAVSLAALDLSNIGDGVLGRISYFY